MSAATASAARLTAVSGPGESALAAVPAELDQDDSTLAPIVPAGLPVSAEVWAQVASWPPLSPVQRRVVRDAFFPPSVGRVAS